MIPLLGIHPKEMKSLCQRDFHTPCVYYSIIHSNEDMEITKVSINEWIKMDIYTYTRILFSHF